MIVTEEEAKTKRCQETFNRTGSVREINCLASGCMAWRWADGEGMDEFRRGYCGKAVRS